jgi:hypothetical protein
LKKLRKIGAAVGVAAGLLILAAPVAGAVPESPTLLPSGYDLVYSGQITAPPGTQTHGFVTCPGKRQPAGGGAFNESAGFASAINSSYPSGHSWEVDFNNQGAFSSAFIVYAICLASNSTYTVVTAPDLTAVNGQQSAGTVECPLHTRVIGGGALSESASTGVNLGDSYPLAHGWQADMDNTSGVDSLYSVYAVCRSRITNYSIQNSGFIANPSGATTDASAVCPGGPDNVAIGGGLYDTSGDPSVQLYDSFPDSSGGWTNYEQNLSAGDDTIDGYAICAGV